VPAGIVSPELAVPAGCEYLSFEGGAGGASFLALEPEGHGVTVLLGELEGGG